MKPKIQIKVPQQMKISILHNLMEERRSGGEHVTLRMMLRSDFPEYHSHNLDLQLERYYYDMGVNLSQTTVSNMVELAEDNEDFKWLWYETLLGAIHTAVYTDPLHKLLIAYSLNRKSKVITQPIISTENIKSSHKKGKEVAPGGTFEEDTITVGDKTKKFGKFGKKVNLPYEIIYDVTIPVLAEFLKGYMGVVWDGKLDMVLDVIMNGDGAQNSKDEAVASSAAVIGVDDINSGITFKDIKRACIRLSRLKRPANIMVGDEEKVNEITELDEFKKRFEGKPLHILKINGYNALPGEAVIADGIAAEKLLLINSKNCVAEYVKQALMIEKDKIISRQVIEVVISEYICYMNLFRNAKVVLKDDAAFSSNGFPDWMTLTKGK
jgi:hypothetical protein